MKICELNIGHEETNDKNISSWKNISKKPQMTTNDRPLVVADFLKRIAKSKLWVRGNNERNAYLKWI